MLAGKKALVLGVANARSIAWGIASRWRAEGADVFVTYQDDRFKTAVEKLVRTEWGPFSPELPLPTCACDVSREDDLANLLQTLEARRFCSNEQPSEHSPDGAPAPGPGAALQAPKLDAVLHSIAYAPAEAMKTPSFLQGTSRDAFVTAHVVSAYSLVAVARMVLPYLAPASSITTLSYIGANKVIPNYNVMGPAKASLESCARALAFELGSRGVRVNSLSPGPVKTLAARGIQGFDDMRRMASERAPLGRTPDMEEITGVATFLASGYASAITGQTIYVDGGFSSTM